VPATVNDLENVTCYPWESFLFFLTAPSLALAMEANCSEMWLAGWESRTIFVLSGASWVTLENSSKRLSFSLAVQITASGILGLKPLANRTK
jgi:hypothetical protein